MNLLYYLLLFIISSWLLCEFTSSTLLNIGPQFKSKLLGRKLDRWECQLVQSRHQVIDISNYKILAKPKTSSVRLLINGSIRTELLCIIILYSIDAKRVLIIYKVTLIRSLLFWFLKGLPVTYTILTWRHVHPLVLRLYTQVLTLALMFVSAQCLNQMCAYS